MPGAFPGRERERLQASYIGAVQAFLEQVAVLHTPRIREDIGQFHEALTRYEERRVFAAEVHKQLSRHRHQHRC